MKILHTADWQLGKPFGAIEGDMAAVLREERFEAVKRIAALARERAVDAVLVAGDVFDSPTVPDTILRRLLAAIADYPGPWVLLPGNHDPALAESPWTRLVQLGPPDNLHLAIEPVPVRLCDDRLVVLPAPLQRRHEPDDVSAAMDRMESPPDALRVGLAHGSVVGFDTEGEAANRIAPDRVTAARLDYLALGDWHGTRRIAPKIWYSGTPEPDRFRDNDPGHVLLVELDAPGEEPRVTQQRLGRFRWQRIDYRCGTAGERDEAETLDRELASRIGEDDEAVVRIRLEGAADLAGRRRLEEVLERWRARCRYLECDLDALRDEPTEADLDAIDHGGFVRAAVERLRILTQEGEEAERARARTALRILHGEHLDLAGDP